MVPSPTNSQHCCCCTYCICLYYGGSLNELLWWVRGGSWLCICATQSSSNHLQRSLAPELLHCRSCTSCEVVVVIQTQRWWISTALFIFLHFSREVPYTKAGLGVMQPSQQELMCSVFLLHSTLAISSLFSRSHCLLIHWPLCLI